MKDFEIYRNWCKKHNKKESNFKALKEFLSGERYIDTKSKEKELKKATSNV